MLKLSSFFVVGLLIAIETSCINALPNCALEVTVSQRSTWLSGSRQVYLYDVSVRNMGSFPVQPGWYIDLVSDGQLDVFQVWNMLDLGDSDSDKHAVLHPTSDWAALGVGQTFTSAGFIANSLVKVKVHSAKCSQISDSSIIEKNDKINPSTLNHGPKCAVEVTAIPRESVASGGKIGQPFQIYDVSVVNFGSCAITAVKLNPSLSGEAIITEMRNIDDEYNVQNFGQLKPGETYTNAGIVVRGHGELFVELSSKGCNCDFMNV